MSSTRVTANGERVRKYVEALAKYVDPDQPGWTRRPFTVWYKQAREWLWKQMEESGLDVRQDATSNLIGTLPGSDTSLKSIMIGSHTDTVTGGGRFDGIIGVVAGIELVRVLQERGITLRHPLEIVDFTAEEPSEFGISTVGSRGMVGQLSSEMLLRKDPDGVSLSSAIERAGGSPGQIAASARRLGDVELYLELHIEQGPFLEQSGNQLGVVTGIVGIHRLLVVVDGAPNHAGTSPMGFRQDALAGASALVLELEAIAGEAYEEAVVATVGRLFVEPNAANVIPGRVFFELEIRSISTGVLEQAEAKFRARAEQLAATRVLKLQIERVSQSEPIRVVEEVREIVCQACEAVGQTAQLPSGAGHDANQLAIIAPIGMIFVPSAGGRSHCPEEWTDWEDVVAGVEALIQAVLLFDEKRGIV